jgi:UDP-N-acetylmuramate--alanine ligase
VAVTTGPDRPPLDPEVEAVITSTATPADDPDVVAARERNLTVVHRARRWPPVRRADTVAVAGTHGKTTTSALLATVLAGTGRDPGWVVGARIAHLDRGAAWGGAGRWWWRRTRATPRSWPSAPAPRW